MRTRYIVEIYTPNTFISVGCANYTQLLKTVRDNRIYYKNMRFYANIDNSSNFKELSCEEILNKKEY